MARERDEEETSGRNQLIECSACYLEGTDCPVHGESLKGYAVVLPNGRSYKLEYSSPWISGFSYGVAFTSVIFLIYKLLVVYLLPLV